MSNFGNSLKTRVTSCWLCRHSCLSFAYISAHTLNSSIINLNKVHLKSNGHSSKIMWKPFLNLNHRRTPRLYFSLIVLSILARLELHFLSIWLPLGSILAPFWLHFGAPWPPFGLPGPPLGHCGIPLGGRVSRRRVQ